MSSQLDLGFGPPKNMRGSVLRRHEIEHYHVQGGAPTVAEAQAGEARAGRQERELLEYFHAHPRARLTRHDVVRLLGFHPSSAGRALSNLAARQQLRKVLADKRPGDGPRVSCHPYELVCLEREIG